MRVLVAVLLLNLLVFLFRIKCLHVTSMHWRPIRVQVIYFYAHNSSAWSMNDLLLGVWMIGHYNVKLFFLYSIFLILLIAGEWAWKKGGFGFSKKAPSPPNCQKVNKSNHAASVSDPGPYRIHIRRPFGFGSVYGKRIQLLNLNII